MANFNFNKAILGGRLTADPELKTTPSGVGVTTVTIAVSRRFGAKDRGRSSPTQSGTQPPADFINVTAWRHTAEFITRFFRKGSSICVVGSIQTRTWTDQQGQKRYATEVVADEAYFVDARGDAASEVPSGTSAQPSQAANPRGEIEDFSMEFGKAKLPRGEIEDFSMEFGKAKLPQGVGSNGGNIKTSSYGVQETMIPPPAPYTGTPKFEDLADDEELPF